VNTVEKMIAAAIVERFGDMPEDIQRHCNVASYDLYFGPYEPGHWRVEYGDDALPDYSFHASVDIVRDWIDGSTGAGYVQDGCWSDREPHGEWHNPETEEYTDDFMGDESGWEYVEPWEYYEVTDKDIRNHYAGKLAEYF
jgi:hypothetical protein